MSAGWVVYVLGIGTLLALAATALASGLRELGRPTRGAFGAALLGIVVLAVIAPRDLTGRMTVPAGAIVTTAAGGVVAREPTLADRLRAAGATIEDAAQTLTATLVRGAGPLATRAGAIAWLVTSGALLVLFAAVNGRLSMARRRWPARSLHGATVRVSPGLGPAVLGLLRAEIVVPRSLLERSDEEQRLIVAHEREHLRAGDHLMLGGAWLCIIALPWHPVVWYLANRIRLAIELDCDARVLRAGASPRCYGALLIDMAAHAGGARVGALALADRTSHLERRILAMKVTTGRHAAVRGLALGALGGLLVLAACEAKVPTATEIASMDVGALEAKSAQLDAVDAKIGNADYFVNGDGVSADSARSIVASKIGSVEVVKGRAVGGRDTIFVTTTDMMMRVRTRAGVDTAPLPMMLNRVGSDAVLMVDNVVQPRGMKLNIQGKDIASINVLKPGKDSRYPNGVIAIVTRKAEEAGSGMGGAKAPDPFEQLERKSVPDEPRVRSTSALPARGPVAGPNPVYLLDGRKSTMAEIAAVPESEIRSVNVYKNDGSGLDPDAANGVIAVKTRNATP